MKIKNLRIILIILKIILIATVILTIVPTNWMYVNGEGETQTTSEYTLMEDIDYTETLENIINPERGFYRTGNLKLKPSENKASLNADLSTKLVHLRVDIGSFSGAVNGDEDLELTEDALNALNETLARARDRGVSVIIRFAYDNFDGKGNLEPSMDMIIKHISQLKPVFYANEDVLTYVELGLFGPWGEMHTSEISKKPENVNRAIEQMLDSVPESIGIAVRTPDNFINWVKGETTSSVNKEIDRAKLNEYVSEKGTPEYRVGMFNDGYLGNDGDMGTFRNRAIEIAWVEKQAMHTLYGGEVVANTEKNKPAINTAAYMSEEAFITHTTYLNAEWNYNVINSWKDETYNGDDELYKGQTGYVYISNHLGYRFVLRKSELTNAIKENEKLKIKLQIENVGFANLINAKKVTLVLKNDEKTYEIPTNINATTWNSKETSNVDIEVSLPEGIELGEWNIYLRISQAGDMSTDNNYKCIRLANEGTWEENLGANYIGKVAISEKPEEPTPDVPDPNPDTPDPNPDTPDPTPDTPDPTPDTPDPTPDTPDPTPDTPDPTPDTPDPTPNTPNTGTNKPNSTGKTDGTTVTGKLPQTGSNIETITISIFLIIVIDIILAVIKIKEN